MKVLPPPVTLRPADNIVQMLRDLADQLEQDAGAVVNVFLVIESDGEDEVDIRCFGPCDDPYRAAGVLTKAARDVLP